MPEYECSPIWLLSDGPAQNVPISELPISSELRALLGAWDRAFQYTYDANYPPDSGFRNSQDREAFLSRGEALADELRKELAWADIEYERVEL